MTNETAPIGVTPPRSDDETAGEAVHAELRLPADIAFVPVLRTVTAGLAARCDLTIDEVEDLRIAVDEASALLLPHATQRGRLDARFAVSDGHLTVTVSVTAGANAEPDRGGFAWTVLNALADGVQIRRGDGSVAIEFSKQRVASTP